MSFRDELFSSLVFMLNVSGFKLSLVDYCYVKNARRETISSASLCLLYMILTELEVILKNLSPILTAQVTLLL